MALFITKSILTKLKTASSETLTPALIDSEDSEEGHKLDKGRKLSVANICKDYICRVCAQQGYTPLLEKLNEEFDIMSGIRNLAQITISIEDPFPKFICTDCLNLLNAAYNFKSKCKESDRKFRNMFSGPESSTYKLQSKSRYDFNLILHNMKCKRKQLTKIQDDKPVILSKTENEYSNVAVSKTQEKEFKCPHCGATFTSKAVLEKHLRARLCRRRACSQCGALVLNVSQHRRSAHPAPPLACPLCGKTFPIRSKLNSHMLVHSDKFQFECDLCEYRSKYKYYLALHMRTHGAGGGGLRCGHAGCRAAFRNPSNLNKHRLVHQDKQIQCPICEKTFRTKVALRGHHEAIHMRIKHPCSFCERTFCYKSDLRKHEIRIHNRKKRDYIGGEPAYKQAERLMKSKLQEQQQNIQIDQHNMQSDQQHMQSDQQNMQSDQQNMQSYQLNIQSDQQVMQSGQTNMQLDHNISEQQITLNQQGWAQPTGQQGVKVELNAPPDPNGVEWEGNQIVAQDKAAWQAGGAGGAESQPLLATYGALDHGKEYIIYTNINGNIIQQPHLGMRWLP